MLAINTLTTLGLNQLEAQVYTLLLTSEPLTGYRIAKELGKPAANVYKALESLSLQGAVLIEEGDNRLCRAVPAEEFLDQLERAFQQQKTQAAEALNQLSIIESNDEHIYQLERPEQVIERAKRILNRATKFVVVDAFPKIINTIQPALEAAVQRGVRVLLQTYKPFTLAGAEVVLTTNATYFVDQWAAEQLNITSDGQELLLALFDKDLTTVHQAIWSQSLYLATIMHIGLAHEHHTHQLLALEPTADVYAEMQRILDLDQFDLDHLPGPSLLFERYKQLAIQTNGSL